MSDVGCSNNKDTQAPDSSTSSKSSSSDSGAAVVGSSDDEMPLIEYSGDAYDSRSNIGFRSIRKGRRDNDNGEEPITDEETQQVTSSQLSPPAHILKRLTPLKRERGSTSPGKLNEEDSGTSIEGSPPRRKPRMYKARTLSASEVLDRVAQLQLSKSLKLEEKKQALKEKLENADKKRYQVNQRKKEAAKKFVQNSKIWASFIETYDDEDDDKDGDISRNFNHVDPTIASHQSSTTNIIDNECLGPEEQLTASGDHFGKFELEPYFEQIPKIIKIQTSIKHFLFQAILDHASNRGDLLLSHLPIDDLFRFLQSNCSSDRFQSSMLVNTTLRMNIKSFLSLIGAPKLGFSDTPSLSDEKAFLLSLQVLYDQKVGSSNEGEDNVFGTRLGKKALHVFGGYNVPDFKKFHYYNDGFSTFIMFKLEDRARKLLKRFKALISLKRLPSKLEIERLRFLKSWRDYLDLLIVAIDDRDTRFLCILYKVNDVLNSSLAVQEHLEQNKYSEVDIPELDKELDELTTSLSQSKKGLMSELKGFKESQKTWKPFYSDESNCWFAKGISLKKRRVEIYREFLELESANNLNPMIQLFVPPGFTVHEWRRFLLLKFYIKYDHDTCEEKNFLKSPLAPSQLQTGLKLRQINSPGKFNKDKTYTDEIHSILKLEKNSYRTLYEEITVCKELNQNLKPLGCEVILKSSKFIKDLDNLRPDELLFDSYSDALGKFMNINQKRFSPSTGIKKSDCNLAGIECYMCAVIQVLQNHCLKHKNLFQTIDEYREFDAFAKSFKDEIVIDRVGNGEQFEFILKVWKDTITQASDLWINRAMVKIMSPRSYGSIDRSYFIRYLLNPSNDLTTLIKIINLEILNSNINEFIQRQFPSGHQVSRFTLVNSKKNIFEFIMTKFFKSIRTGGEFELPISFNICLPDLLALLESYRKILQVIFIQIAVGHFFNLTPIIVTGNEAPGFNLSLGSKSIIKPNMSVLGSKIFEYFNDKVDQDNHDINADFSLDDPDIEALTLIIKDHVRDKILKDPRTSDIYSHCQSTLEEAENLARKNTVESSLMTIMKRVKYYPVIAKSCNNAVFFGVYYSKPNSIREMNPYMGDAHTEFDNLVFQLKKVISINYAAFKDLIYDKIYQF